MKVIFLPEFEHILDEEKINIKCSPKSASLWKVSNLQALP